MMIRINNIYIYINFSVCLIVLDMLKNDHVFERNTMCYRLETNRREKAWEHRQHRGHGGELDRQSELERKKKEKKNRKRRSADFAPVCSHVYPFSPTHSLLLHSACHSFFFLFFSHFSSSFHSSLKALLCILSHFVIETQQRQQQCKIPSLSLSTYLHSLFYSTTLWFLQWELLWYWIDWINPDVFNCQWITCTDVSYLHLLPSKND